MFIRIIGAILFALALSGVVVVVASGAMSIQGLNFGHVYGLVALFALIAVGGMMAFIPKELPF